MMKKEDIKKFKSLSIEDISLPYSPSDDEEILMYDEFQTYQYILKSTELSLILFTTIY